MAWLDSSVGKSAALVSQRSWVRFPFKPKFFSGLLFPQLLKLSPYRDDLHLLKIFVIFKKIQTPIKIHSLMRRASNLAIFSTFSTHFSFLVSVLCHDHFLLLTRSRDLFMQRAYCNTRRMMAFLPLYVWFNSTYYHPPGHKPRDLPFFRFLAVYSPPPGTREETIPHPWDSQWSINTSFIYKIEIQIAKPDVLLELKRFFLSTTNTKWKTTPSCSYIVIIYHHRLPWSWVFISMMEIIGAFGEGGRGKGEGGRGKGEGGRGSFLFLFNNCLGSGNITLGIAETVSQICWCFKRFQLCVKQSDVKLFA